MATKQNQGLQALIITLVILVIMLGVGLVMVNNAKKTAVSRAEGAEQSARDKETQYRQLLGEVENYKQWMGFQSTDSYETVQTTYQEDMANWGRTFDEANRSYRRILDNIYKENQTAALNEAAAKQNARDLTQQLLALQEEMKKQNDAYNAELNKLKQDNAAQKNKFDADYARVVKEKEELSTQIDQKRTEIDNLQAQRDAKVKELEDELGKLSRANLNLRESQVDPDPFAQPSDGKIAYVNQREQTVWINLGSEDKLRPQVTFMVYGGDENDAISAERKGTIEVTRILNRHLAEARITSEDIKRPIMGGDQIYSQVWSAGRQVGFGIVGFIDLDGNGSEDLESLKRIIATSGGKVDAAPGSDGKLNVDTRFVIAGADPTTGGKQEYLAHWQSTTDDAASLGIEVISLDQFLDLIGWKPHAGTTQLGVNSRTSDVKAPVIEGGQPTTFQTQEDVFRKRIPPARY